jgi:type II secretory pathway pseudopilin PulG
MAWRMNTIKIHLQRGCPGAFERRRWPGSGSRSRLGCRAVARTASFTLLEVMVALFIFMLVLMAIYSTWLLILRGTDAAQRAAAAVQRARMAIRTIEDALVTVQMFNGNMTNYLFLADTSGDFVTLELTARLPESFPGVGRYGDQVVRRVRFFTEPSRPGGADLLMSQKPLLMEVKDPAEVYTIVLARDVTVFRMAFYDPRKDEWLEEWKYTNQLPRLVQVVLGQGRRGRSTDPQDVVTRVIAIPSVAVPADVQGFGPGAVMPPGVVPPGAVPPGAVPPGTPIMPGQPGLVPSPAMPGVMPPGYAPGVTPPGVIQPTVPIRPVVPRR